MKEKNLCNLQYIHYYTHVSSVLTDEVENTALTNVRSEQIEVVKRAIRLCFSDCEQKRVSESCMIVA